MFSSRSPKIRSIAVSSFDRRPGSFPLGKDPVSGRQEFLHILSDSAVTMPKRDVDTKRWKVEVGTGIIFVLLPGATLAVGSQNKDERKPNYDRRLQSAHRIHQVTLSPFFMSKYEMTQAQWMRLSGGRNPSWPQRTSSSPEFRLPVNRVSWRSAEELLRRFGMACPSGAQWEYACRAGTRTAFYYDLTNEEEIHRHALCAFRERQRSFFVVGMLFPNPWGFHDMFGNAREWTSDQNAGAHPRAGTGRTPENGEQGTRILRGAYFASYAHDMRVAYAMAAEETDSALPNGIRPVRMIEP